ncbi:MAG: hypothetical protein RJA66_232 [Actinomycetota bacterium]
MSEREFENRPKRAFSGERSSGTGSGRGGTDRRQDAPSGRARRNDDPNASRPDWQQRVARPVDYDKPKSPLIPDEITEKDLELGLRVQLKTLTPENAERVARHLAMVGLLIDQDPQLAHEHALAAAGRAARIALVRETVGITAYTVGDFAVALRELLTFRRISGSNDQLPLMVDCERGLGRPDRALELGRSVDRAQLLPGVRVNLAIAMSGARLDRGENELALAELQIPELNPEKVFAYSVPLFFAYADTLEILGKDAESKRWATLAERADAALMGNPGPEDEVFQVLEEFEIPVRTERKEWEPREERDGRSYRDDRGSRDERPRNFAPRNPERPTRPYGERSERPLRSNEDRSARPARDSDAPRPQRDRAPREGARDRKFGEDRGR